MRHSVLTKNIIISIKRFFDNPQALACWLIVALIVPNIVLDITEPSDIMWKTANVALPLGCYMLFISASKRIGVTAWLMLPFMILAAFQLVLTYLYGESIIAVDMFMNVVTTNVSEATELLANLFMAILSVVILYLPPLIWGAVLAFRRKHLPSSLRRETALWGCGLAVFGAGMAGMAITGKDNASEFHREIFPVNVICNMVEAINRADEASHYHELSAGFTYGATSRRDKKEREIYLFVVGETSRAMNWELGGYKRKTNPRLSGESNAVFCRKAISESNTTHKSVPMLMSSVSAENFDSISHYKSILTAMKEAGFHTHFFSNQAPNRSYTQFFGEEADDVRYSALESKEHPYDSALLDMIKDVIADTIHAKQFIVLHTYGSHFLYRDRYPDEFATFKPDNAIDANRGNRRELVNAYDNSIICTDAFLSDAIDLLKSADCHAALFYSSDHGEDIFDDKRERFLHASPNPTYYQLHVAMLVWLSDRMNETYPSYMHALRRNADRYVSPQKTMFNTALETAGINSPEFDATQSLVNEQYRPTVPVYLTDLNVAVPLNKSGLKASDIDNIEAAAGIKIRNK